MGDAGDESKDRAEGEAEADSEEHSVSHGSGESAERAVFAAEEVVGEVEGTEDVERAADDADQGDGVVIEHFCQNATGGCARLNTYLSNAAGESGAVAVLAEKPSVARDIAKVLGAGARGDGYLHGNGYVVTWAIGHLASLAQPHEIRPEWKRWRRDTLPMLPDAWPLVVYEKTKDQFEVVGRFCLRRA